MADILSKWFGKFASETGILGDIRQYQGFWPYVLLVLGALGCFLGFWVYRAYFAVFLFFLIAFVCTVCMSGRVEWGAVVTCFAVVGTAAAVLSYGWYRFGGCILCALIGVWIGCLVEPSVWTAAAGGILGGIFMLLFPVLALSSLTALWGGWLLADVLFLWFWPGAGPLLKAAAVALCAGAGFGLQMLTSRRQTMFRKVCPDRVTHWLEKRKTEC